MGTSIDQLLPKDIYDAAINANSPTAANPFATMADIAGGGGDLAATLTLGENANAGQDVILHDTGKFIIDDDQLTPVSSNLEFSISASQALIETTGVAGASRILTLKSNQPGSGIRFETGAIRIGSAVNHNISIAGITGSRTATLQDSDGILAYNTGVVWSAPTNVSTDRALDADSTTLDELADVVGTLIADLRTGNILD